MPNNSKNPQSLNSGGFCDQACKPSSVVCDNLSRQDVAVLLQPPVGSVGPTIAPQSVLHRIGFTWRQGLPCPGELLPRLSILAGEIPGGLFLLHCP